jgi:Domain of unknown function (DUF1737)
MKYKILIAHTAIELSEGVNKHIAMEWQPLGGIAICNTGTDGIILYLQAVEMHGVAERTEAVSMAERN